MRAGLVVSAVGHAGLIALAIVGIGMTRPFEAAPVESISVDLISVEEFSNIRKGVLDSEVVDTETPSIVDTETPAEVAQPTGNTEENQVKPEDTAIVTPAPTQETAPEPVPDPVVEPQVAEPTPPQPEPDPVVEPAAEPAAEAAAQPEPSPTSEPVEPAPAPEPAEVATPDVTEDPANAAPKPAIRTASIDEKRAQFQMQQDNLKKAKDAEAKKEADEKKKKEDDAKKKKEEERVREAKAKEDEAARLADEVANIINTEESRGATTGAGGEASLGKETGTAARLSQSEQAALIAQIRGCLNVPMGAAEAGVMARLSFEIDAAGNVSQPPRILIAPTSQLEQAYASAAVRAVQRCGPYLMAKGQSVAALFDPRQF